MRGAIADPVRREDRRTLVTLMGEVTGEGCPYLKRLSDIDLDILREVVTESVARTKRSWA